MTEDEYILVSMLGRLRVANYAIRDAASYGTMDMSQTLLCLDKLVESCEKKIKIKDAQQSRKKAQGRKHCIARN